jgi:hypothetical protein
MQKRDSDNDSDSDSDSDILVRRHCRTSTEVLVVMMTSQYCLGKGAI